jgi:hypothetical protein
VARVHEAAAAGVGAAGLVEQIGRAGLPAAQ